MDKKDTIRKIDELFQTASDLAVELVESEARKILAADPELDEFVMAMGGCFFTTTNKERGFHPREAGVDGSNILDDDDIDTPEFFYMLDDLDEQFNIKGCPMRFTANSQVTTDW